MLFDKMAQACAPRNSVTYNASIIACERARKRQYALEFFDDMGQAGVPHDTDTYGANISMGEKGSHWQRALKLFDEMRQAGVPRNSVTYNACQCAWKGRAMAARIKTIR